MVNTKWDSAKYFGKRYDDNLRVIFDQCAKVALNRFGCAKQSNNL